MLSSPIREQTQTGDAPASWLTYFNSKYAAGTCRWLIVRPICFPQGLVKSRPGGLIPEAAEEAP